MCGIAGIITFDQSKVDKKVLIKMGDRLEHRGPDAKDTWLNSQANVGFSHRRLSIIDVAGSPQPMSSKSGESTICFNGEIFNYAQLRKSWKYPYKTNGDTETIIAGFEQDKNNFVNSLRGQFAFAIFEKKGDLVHLYRDRLGILPLYYYRDENKFVFASEIKALLVAIGEMPSIDKQSLVDYLGQRGVPAPNTLYEGIKKLEPGHHLTVSTNGKVKNEAWYTIPTGIEIDEDLTLESASTQLDRKLYGAVEAALVADVPVGAYLSGGIDSSLICAMISKIRGGGKNTLSTFAAKFSDGSSLDETPFAKTVSDMLGTDHHEVNVSPKDFIETWPKLTYQFDAPIPEPPDIAFSYLAKKAREHVTVVLSGEGSDELFGGYPKYQYANLVNKLSKIPYFARKPIFKTIEKMLPASMNRQRTLVRAASQRNEIESFKTWFAPFTSAETREMFDAQSHDTLEEIHKHSRGDVLHRMSYVDLHSWLSDNILERGDRTSMMHSLELRPPFLDVEVLEFSRTLPSNLMANRNESKRVVREVGKKYLPQEIFERNKHGFKVPLDDWFRNSLKDYAYDHLASNDSLARELFDRKFINELLDNHVSEKFNDGMRIYTLVALEMWYRHRATA